MQRRQIKGERMTNEDITRLWANTEDPSEFARAIEQLVRDECWAQQQFEWQEGFNEGTIAGYEYGQTDMREECAVICEDHNRFPSEELAEAIRAGGKE